MAASGWDLIKVCLEALSRHPLRTALAVTAMVIGVGAVTAMVSVIEGARREVIKQVGQLGLNNAVVRPKSLAMSTAQWPAQAAVITHEDADRLRGLLTFARVWSPLSEHTGSVKGPSGAVDATALGVGPGFQHIMHLEPAEGRLLGVLDVEQDHRVAVLGAELAADLFGEASPLGSIVRVDGEVYTVVGVLAKRESPGATGGTLSPRDLNGMMLVPTRRDAFFGLPVGIGELWVQMPDSVPVDQGGILLEQALLQLHRGRPDFEVLIPRELQRQRLSAQRTFSIVLGSVSVLALVSGGIGIMNLMLASVLERTSEIGLRRSVGARRRWILGQFLVESTVMALAGGVIGIFVGIAGSLVLSSYAGWPTHISLWAVLVAVVTSTAVGVFFGTYPALRAANLEPVEAVRYE